MLAVPLAVAPGTAAGGAPTAPDDAAGLLRDYLGAPRVDAALERRAVAALEAHPDWEAVARQALVAPTPSAPRGGRVLSTTEGLGFRIHVDLPTGYGAEPLWPAVVGLHPAVRQAGAGAVFCASPVLDPYRERAVLLCPRLEGTAWDTPGAAEQVAATLNWAARELRIDPDAVIVTGYSLGGHGAWYLAAHMADRFVAAIPLAGAPRSPVGLENARAVRVLAVNAQADRVVSPTASGEAAARLRALGGRATTILTMGDHFAMEAHVQALRPHLEGIWGERRDPRPRLIEWRGTAPEHLHWLEVDSVRNEAEVTAKLVGGRIVLRSQNVERVTLLLSPRLVPLERVEVEWNGLVVHSGGVKRDAAVLLDWLRRRTDPEALVHAALPLIAPGVEDPELAL